MTKSKTLKKKQHLMRYDIQATKSAPNPSAQYTILCDENSSWEKTDKNIQKLLHDTKTKNKEAFACVSIMNATGARCSEVLSIRHNNITNNGRFLIKGSKGSESMTYYVSEVTEYMKECKKDCIDPFKNTSRFAIYRLLKKYDIKERFEGHVNESVTHYFRHKLATDISRSIEDKEQTTKALRHVNKSNRKYYEH